MKNVQLLDFVLVFYHICFVLAVGALGHQGFSDSSVILTKDQGVSKLFRNLQKGTMNIYSKFHGDFTCRYQMDG